MAVTVKKLTPNIMVEHVNSTVDFYKNVLGFELLTTVPEQGTFDWAMMKRDTVEIMFQSRTSLSGDLPQFAVRTGNTADHDGLSADGAAYHGGKGAEHGRDAEA